MSETRKFFEYTSTTFKRFGDDYHAARVHAEFLWIVARENGSWLKYIMMPSELIKDKNPEDWQSYSHVSMALMMTADMAVIRFEDGSEKIVKSRWGEFE